VLKSVRLTLSFLEPRQRFFFYGLIFLRAIVGILDVAGIALIGLIGGIAAAGIGGGKPLTFLGFTFPVLDAKGLLLLVLLVLSVFVFKAVLAVVLSRVLTKFVARVEVENVARLGRFLFAGNLSRIQSLSRAEIQWSLTESSSNAFNGLMTSFATVINEGVLLVLICVTFFVVDAQATFAVIIFFAVLIGFIQLAIGRGLTKSGSEVAQGTIATTDSVNDMTEAFREMTVLGKQDFFLAKMTRSRRRLAEGMGLMTFLAGMPRYVVETGLMIGVVALVGWQFLNGQLADGVVVIGIFLTGGVRIMASLLPLQSAFAGIQNQREKAALSQQLLVETRQWFQSRQRSETFKKPEIDVEVSATAMSVQLSEVNFRYPGAESDALIDINFIVERGQHVAIIGPSGAGKTTLVDLILGLVEPSSGTVQIEGFPPTLLRGLVPGTVTYVPQKPGIVFGTIAENIALGVGRADINVSRVKEVLTAAHLMEFVDGLPEGIWSDVGKQANSLSGGQIQRLGLARALYSSPRLLILDEATSALDAGAEAVVAASLSELGSDVSVITIAHRLSTVQHADNVFVMEGGRITGSGTFSHLRKTVPMVAEYVKLMSFETPAE
jgi:ABC-type multidrug transport system fused ATPase/permease subunit